MSTVITKGGNFNITRYDNTMNNLTVALGWADTTKGKDQPLSIDSSIILLGSNEKVLSDDHFSLLSALNVQKNVTAYSKNSYRTKDRDAVNLDLTAIPNNIQKILFVVTIFDAINRGENFSHTTDVYIRIVNPKTNVEIVRYNMNEPESTATSMIIGELYKYNLDWKFRAVGQGYFSGIAGVAKDFGLKIQKK